MLVKNFLTSIFAGAVFLLSSTAISCDTKRSDGFVDLNQLQTKDIDLNLINKNIDSWHWIDVAQAFDLNILRLFDISQVNYIVAKNELMQNTKLYVDNVLWESGDTVKANQNISGRIIINSNYGMFFSGSTKQIALHFKPYIKFDLKKLIDQKMPVDLYDYINYSDETKLEILERDLAYCCIIYHSKNIVYINWNALNIQIFNEKNQKISDFTSLYNSTKMLLKISSTNDEYFLNYSSYITFNFVVKQHQ